MNKPLTAYLAPHSMNNLNIDFLPRITPYNNTTIDLDYTLLEKNRNHNFFCTNYNYITLNY